MIQFLKFLSGFVLGYFMLVFMAFITDLDYFSDLSYGAFATLWLLSVPFAIIFIYIFWKSKPLRLFASGGLLGIYATLIPIQLMYSNLII